MRKLNPENTDKQIAKMELKQSNGQNPFEKQLKQENTKPNKIPRKTLHKASEIKNPFIYCKTFVEPLEKENKRSGTPYNLIVTKDACFACDACTQTKPRKKTVCVIM